MPSIAYQALGSLYQILGDAAADGLSAEHLGGLERCHRDAVMGISDRWPAWGDFRNAVDGAFLSSHGPEQFAARVMSLRHESKNTPPSKTCGSDAVGAIAEAHKELGAALEKYDKTTGGPDREDALTWVLESSQHVSRLGKLAQLARAAVWLSEDFNAARKGRRALAFAYAILGDPSRFLDRAGAACKTMADVCQAHNFTDRRMRDHLHELARRGISAPGYEAERTRGKTP